jgi:hypothetical protein
MVIGLFLDRNKMERLREKGYISINDYINLQAESIQKSNSNLRQLKFNAERSSLGLQTPFQKRLIEGQERHTHTIKDYEYFLKISESFSSKEKEEVSISTLFTPERIKIISKNSGLNPDLIKRIINDFERNADIILNYKWKRNE